MEGVWRHAWLQEGAIPWPSTPSPLHALRVPLESQAAHLGSQGFRKSLIMSAVAVRQDALPARTEPTPEGGGRDGAQRSAGRW